MQKSYSIVLAFLYIAILFVCCPSTQAEQKNQGDDKTFVPFSHIYNIVPGESRISAVVKILGEPQHVEITETWEVAGVRGGGDKKLQYTNLGLFFLISVKHIKQADPVIDAAWAEAPFKGKSPNGLYIGMSRKEALEICRRDYHQTQDLGNSLYFAEKPGGESDFQVWFEDQKLMRMKIFRR